ncbi:hypothetical protein BH10PLA1_BH10PLA1_11940 [soil metagenome]
MQPTTRADNEIEHGRFLAEAGAEDVWGWGTPAGKIRARRRAEFIARGANLSAGMNVLEVGCGTGNFTELMASSGASIIGVDISPELLVLAEKRNLPADRIKFIAARFEDCDLHGPFDAIVGSSVLHHLDYRVALRRIFEMLKPGGVLSFAEPNMLNPQIAIQKNIPAIKRRLGDSPDETAFVRFKLKRLLREIGFVDIAIKPFDWLHPSTPRPLIGVVSGLGRVVEVIPGLREFSGSLYIRARKPT